MVVPEQQRREDRNGGLCFEHMAPPQVHSGALGTFRWAVNHWKIRGRANKFATTTGLKELGTRRNSPSDSEYAMRPIKVGLRQVDRPSSCLVCELRHT